MARRGVLRRVIDGIGSLFRSEAPSIPRTPSPPSTPGVSSLRRQAVDNILNLPMVNETEIAGRVRYMTIRELRWTIKASLSQLRWRARQDADRLTADNIPLNPWWYR